MGVPISKRALLLLAAAVLLAGGLAYCGAGGHGLTNFDDLWQIRDNELVGSPVTLEKLAAVLFAPYHGEYQPVKLLSFLADRVTFTALGVDVARGMHLENVLFHIVNSVLVALISVVVVNDLAGERVGEKGIIFVGFFSGLYFVLHPVHVESVAWASSRKDLLSFLFMALSFLLFRAWVLKGGASRAALTIILFALALGSKATVVAFPLVALVYWALLGRPATKRAVMVVAALVVLTVVYVMVSTSIAAEGGYRASPIGGSYLAQFLTSVKTFPFYMRLLTFPVNLSAVYRLAPAAGLADAGVWWGALMLAAQVAVVVLVRARTARFIVLWYLVGLLPVLGIVPTVTVPALAADRYAYIASVSFALAPALILWHIRGGLLRRGAVSVATALMAAAIVYAGVLGVATWSRNRVWRSSQTLWRDVLSKYPKANIAMVNLGHAYFQEGRHEEARSLYRRVLKSNPGYLVALVNLAASYEAAGDTIEAKAAYQRALIQQSSIAPAYTKRERARAACGVGRAYFGEEKFLAARRLAARALALDNEVHGGVSLYVKADAKIKELRAIADDLIAMGDEAAKSDPRKAERFYLHAADAAREYHLPQMRLGDLYYKEGRWEDAWVRYREAENLGQEGADFRYRLGVAALKTGRYPDAAENLSRAIALDPSMTRARVKLAVARAYLGEPGQALLMLKKVLDEDPSNAEARENFEAIKPVVEEVLRKMSDDAR